MWPLHPLTPPGDPCPLGLATSLGVAWVGQALRLCDAFLGSPG